MGVPEEHDGILRRGGSELSPDLGDLLADRRLAILEDRGEPVDSQIDEEGVGRRQWQLLGTPLLVGPLEARKPRSELHDRLVRPPLLQVPAKHPREPLEGPLAREDEVVDRGDTEEANELAVYPNRALVPMTREDSRH
jgi:hypothetical protein